MPEEGEEEYEDFESESVQGIVKIFEIRTAA